MPRTSNAKTTANVATVDESTVATDVAVDKNMNKNTNKYTKKVITTEPLEDYDEIEVESLIPNVSYKDSKTGDMYEWNEVGHIEPMTFETLKNMWRNHKGYFRDMCLRPNDDRVINKFGLTKTFEKYEFLMDESNYNRKNIEKLRETISNTPNGLKYAIVNRIKDMVASGKLVDIKVIKELERNFDLDLISFLN